MYKLEYKEQFLQDVETHRKAGRRSVLQKLEVLKNELREHPKTGTGNPEKLSHDRKGEWSRHITLRHRLVYKIHEDVVTVILVSAWGHYGDK